jgi:hypothetical protein
MTNPLEEIAESADRSYTYTDGVSVRPKKVSYGDIQLKSFIVREVYIDDELSGEYHIRILYKDYTEKALIFFSRHLPKTCEIGLIDNLDYLHLEFQIYIKTSDQLLIPAMVETMELLDGVFKSEFL